MIWRHSVIKFGCTTYQNKSTSFKIYNPTFQKWPFFLYTWKSDILYFWWLTCFSILPKLLATLLAFTWTYLMNESNECWLWPVHTEKPFVMYYIIGHTSKKPIEFSAISSMTEENRYGSLRLFIYSSKINYIT